MLAQHGEAWARRTIATITDERDQARQPSLSEDERVALRQQWIDLQPFTRRTLEGLLTGSQDTRRMLRLIAMAIGEERTHATCNSELEQHKAYLEIKLSEYRAIIDLEDRAIIERQFMAVGQLLDYRALLKFRIGTGIEKWEDYRSWTDERTLAEVVIYSKELLSQAEAVKENAAEKSKLRQAEQRLIALENQRKEQQGRIAELEEQLAREHEQATDADLLIAIQEAGRKIADLERQAELHDQVRIELETAQTQAEEGRDQVQRRFRDYVRMTNEKLGQLSGELAKFRQERERNQDAREVEEQERQAQRIQELEAERAAWAAWKEAEIVLHAQFTAMQRYLQEHQNVTIPIVRNGVTLKVVALGKDGLAVTEDHGIVRLSDDEAEQGRIWVAQKTGVPIIAYRQPIGSKHDREGRNN
jgi:hypothetical protein